LQISLLASVSLCGLHNAPTYNPLIVSPLQWYLNCVCINSIKQPVQPNPAQSNQTRGWMDLSQIHLYVEQRRSHCGCRGCPDTPNIRLGCPTPQNFGLYPVTCNWSSSSTNLFNTAVITHQRPIFTSACIEIVWRKDGRERNEGRQGGEDRGGGRTPPIFETCLRPWCRSNSADIKSMVAWAASPVNQQLSGDQTTHAMWLLITVEFLRR